MLDRLISTLIGQHMGTETRDIRFSSPGLARLHFFLLQKLGNSPLNIVTNARVLSRSKRAVELMTP